MIQRLREKSAIQLLRGSVVERHLQTAIQTILVALIAWAGYELVNLGKNTVVLQQRLIYQGDQLQELRQELREWSNIYYRRSEANRELDLIKSRIDGLETRVTVVEREQARASTLREANRED